ncbi:hypothetical protein TWF694_011678 [Orbilia ellipsospora]|uniref:Uncharacterized protein n=1 Tax=Orbilia ellipsospora TaxID=2528407 RepID=A0AAV9X6B9_9PEZI
MASTDIQNLLRFLTGPAKLPLRDAMGKAKPLLTDGLSSPDLIAKSSLDKLLKIFPDEKVAKQVLSAAKRVTKPQPTSKKRSSSTTDDGSQNLDESPISPSKRRRANPTPTIDTLKPQTWETGLELPSLIKNEDQMSIATVTTNRAPLLLAFAVISLGYTHPWLPMSSRFSLAQGLLELTAASKAKNIGILREGDGKDEELEEGYKRVRVLGKEIPVLRRWDVAAGVTTTENETDAERQEKNQMQQRGKNDGKSTVDASINLGNGANVSKDDESAGNVATSIASSSTGTGTGIHRAGAPSVSYDEPIYWALSPKLLANPPTASKLNPSALPIQLPHAAHSYLVRSFSKEMLPLVLGALHMVYESWVHSLDSAELDRRGWGWYCRVRPSVEDGPEGWGGKGVVRLKDILSLRKGGVK